MIKVLVVDDSAFMRKMLSDIFKNDSNFTVVDMARNGKDAIEKVKKYQPDVVTMDVEMPVMNGIEALEVIMRENPLPVIMISSLTHEGAEATLRALSLGAVDFVTKAGGSISSISTIQEEIIEKCKNAVKANVQVFKRGESLIDKPLTVAIQPSTMRSAEKIVAIGTSTGGPRALQEVITRLPANLSCGVVIVQHMPPGFTKSLADRLNSLSAITVKEAEQNDIICPGMVFIAPGNYHMILEKEGSKTVIKLNQNVPIGCHRPAVDPMFESVARVYGNRAIGVILTGMGRDGAKGLLMIKQAHGYTIAEDQSTAVIFGMPKSAIDIGAAEKVVALPNIAAEIVKGLTK